MWLWILPKGTWGLWRQEADVPQTSESQQAALLGSPLLTLATLPSLSDPKEPLAAAQVPLLLPCDPQNLKIHGILNCLKGIGMQEEEFCHIGGCHSRL